MVKLASFAFGFLFLGLVALVDSAPTSLEGWVKFPGAEETYFFLGLTPYATFDGAEAFCQSIGGHLPSVHSKEENMFIFDRMGPGSPPIWIGTKRDMTYLPFVKPYVWYNLDGTPVDIFDKYENCTMGVDCLWAVNPPYKGRNRDEPNGGAAGAQECVAMNARTMKLSNPGAWRDESCSKSYKVACKYAGTVSTTSSTASRTTTSTTSHTTTSGTTTTTTPACVPEYSYDYIFSPDGNTENAYYYSFDDGLKLTFSFAEAFCQKNCGHLASVHSPQENLYLYSNLAPKLSTDAYGLYWLGVQRDQSGSLVKPYSWVNTDGTAMDIFDQYAGCTMGKDCLWANNKAVVKNGVSKNRDEPNNGHGNEFCVAMNGLGMKKYTNKGTWRDANCGDAYYFICKQNPGM